ncbi:conserved hypothetical protein (plasmid) [Borreliella burgdorferi 64b]|nr:conserved hypothetical protein [Borreliella burgdorferi 64b]
MIISSKSFIIFLLSYLENYCVLFPFLIYLKNYYMQSLSQARHYKELNY